jgi:hypothetical protein
MSTSWHNLNCTAPHHFERRIGELAEREKWALATMEQCKSSLQTAGASANARLDGAKAASCMTWELGKQPIPPTLTRLEEK